MHKELAQLMSLDWPDTDSQFTEAMLVIAELIEKGAFSSGTIIGLLANVSRVLEWGQRIFSSLADIIYIVFNLCLFFLSKRGSTIWYPYLSQLKILYR